MSKRLTGYTAGLVSHTDAAVEKPVEMVEEKRQHEPSTFRCYCGSYFWYNHVILPQCIKALLRTRNKI